MKSSILIILYYLIVFQGIFGQNYGDYQSFQSGDWDDASNWEIWVEELFNDHWEVGISYPVSSTGNEVTILDGHNINIPVGVTLTNPGSPINVEGTGSLTINGTLNMSNIIVIDNSGTLTISSSGDLNLSGKLTGVSGSSASLIVAGTLDVSSSTSYIYGGAITNLFPNITISGTLTTPTILNANNISITSAGRLNTSFYISAAAQTEGWWYQSNRPNTGGSSLLGTVEYSSSTIQNIATLLPYNNLEISTAGTTVSGGLDVSGTLTINSGASLNIASTTDATIKDLFVTDANSLTLASDASMIISNSLSGTGAATVEVQRTVTEDAWHLISAPHSDYTMDDLEAENTLSVNPGNINPDLLNHVALAYFNVGANSWVTSTSPSGNMNPGQGFMTGVSEAAYTTLSFTGTPNYGDKPDLISITDSNKGTNAVGNPYTSALEISAFIEEPDNYDLFIPSFYAIYTYNPATNQYDAHNGNDSQKYVQSCQGFLLNADASGSLSFTKEMQAHNSSDPFFKKSTKDEDYSSILLNINNGETKIHTKINFRDSATKGLDRGKDLGIIKRSENYNIYTKLVEDNGVDFCIQSLPNTSFKELSIPVGIDLSAGGIVGISADAMNLQSECLIILEDRELGVYTDLKASEASYTVDLPANTTGTGRFFLHTFNPQTVNTEMDDLQNITIFAFDKEIIVQGEIAKKSSVRVYDLSGRMVLKTLLNDSYRNTISASELLEGVYIVHLHVGDKIKTSKLFLK